MAAIIVFRSASDKAFAVWSVSPPLLLLLLLGMPTQSGLYKREFLGNQYDSDFTTVGSRYMVDFNKQKPILILGKTVASKQGCEFYLNSKLRLH